MTKTEIDLINRLFAIFPDADGTFSIIHHTGVLVGSEYPTQEQATIDVLRIGAGALERLRGIAREEAREIANDLGLNSEEAADILEYLAGN